MKFICECCGKEQDSWPSIGYKTPRFYHELSEEEKTKKAVIDSDICVIKDGDTTYRFIRGVLIQKVNDSCQNLEYGVWVSLSEKSFDDYIENSNKEEHSEIYFGWFNSFIPDYEYEEQIKIKTNVVTQGNGKRPIIEIQRNEESSSKLVRDFYNGIAKDEALYRIGEVIKK